MVAGPVLQSADDYANCLGAGGTWNCASCRRKDGSGGALPCDTIRKADYELTNTTEWDSWTAKTVGEKIVLPMHDLHRHKNISDYADCPDSLVTGQYWMLHSAGYDGIRGSGRCMSFTGERALRSSVESTSSFPFGAQEWGKKANQSLVSASLQKRGSRSGLPNKAIYAVLTKAGVGHPNDADEYHGYIALKRTVLYKHGNTTKADVSKTGYCIRCPTKVFASIESYKATDSEKKAFVNGCVSEAFDCTTGFLRAEYWCSTEEEHPTVRECPGRGQALCARLSGQVAFEYTLSVF